MNDTKNTKTANLALQDGGAQSAFACGVLEREHPLSRAEQLNRQPRA